jgi:hypothetical protein
MPADANQGRDWRIRLARAYDCGDLPCFRRIKAFFGTSENALKTQIWIAVWVYVPVAIVRKKQGSATN